MTGSDPFGATITVAAADPLKRYNLRPLLDASDGSVTLTVPEVSVNSTAVSDASIVYVLPATVVMVVMNLFDIVRGP